MKALAVICPVNVAAIDDPDPKRVRGVGAGIVFDTKKEALEQARSLTAARYRECP